MPIDMPYRERYFHICFLFQGPGKSLRNNGSEQSQDLYKNI